MLDLQKEKEFFTLGHNFVAGVDEAGRGPLAGPVVAACVIIDNNFQIEPGDLELVADSKKFSAKKREIIFKAIKEKALSVEISVVSRETIDKVNILRASLAAMRKAVEKSRVKPDFILVDGNFKIPKLDIPQKAIVSGDALVWVIAAASIIAKVSRDFLMEEADKLYPEYGFAKHKGYGTKAHIAKIMEIGPCPIHRRSFAPIKDMSLTD